MKDISIIYLERICQVLSGLLISYLVINYFTANDYGIYKYVVSIGSTFLIFVMLGFNWTNIRYIPKYLVQKEKEKIAYQVVHFFFLNCWALAGLLILVFVGVKYQWFKMGGDVSPYAIVTLLSLYYLKIYFGESLLIALSRRTLLSLARIALYAIQITLFSIAIYSKVEINEFIVYLVVFSCFETILLLLASARAYRDEAIGMKICKFELKPAYRYSLNNYGFTVANFMKDNAATIIVVSYLYTFTEVAYYSVALIIPNVIRGFSPSRLFSGMILPEFVKKYEQAHDTKALFSGLNLLSKINTVYMLLAIIFSMALYHQVVSGFFNTEYAEQTQILAMCLFFNIVLLSYLDLSFMATNVLERSDLVFKINLLSVSNILFMVVLAPLGKDMIGVANLASSAVTATTFWWVLNKIFQLRINIFLANKQIILAGLILLLGAWLLLKLNLIAFVVGYFALALVSCLYLLKSSFFSPEERLFFVKKFLF